MARNQDGDKKVRQIILRLLVTQPGIVHKALSINLKLQQLQPIFLKSRTFRAVLVSFLMKVAVWERAQTAKRKVHIFNKRRLEMHVRWNLNFYLLSFEIWVSWVRFRGHIYGVNTETTKDMLSRSYGTSPCCLMIWALRFMSAHHHQRQSKPLRFSVDKLMDFTK